MRPHVCAQAPITWLSLLVYIDAKPNLDEEAIMLRLFLWVLQKLLPQLWDEDIHEDVRSTK